MKKIISIFCFVILSLTLTMGNAFANDKKTYVVDDFTVKVVIDDKTGDCKDEAVFYPLRKICEEFGYTVNWHGDRAYIIKGTGEAIIKDGQGNEVNAVIVTPGVTVVELISSTTAKIEQYEENYNGYEAFIRRDNNCLYVYKDFFIKYLGLKEVK
ncbi:hypothetical protein Dred_2786 [Desulforamulus reducens MI-1]|uniref:Copper amine oxidase-like N-terminal domain-containing protein n=1 Tax=Desulforamulus reducens (strain ATCC BAA-1160 / DSM 100696 / MI-1) TaxID=349161 RepID=A4J887_DESRM|nr:hypothetical protein [Desulforamulus reducens]ABO51290.1 hypothetical protein Dred_2786 [Desulforamulus reducens MI-1]